ncbi:hypothetical protein ACH36K_11460 [Clostridium sp. MB05]|uniref:hypothetical protein n=1 Tax=Clostridium sp. MB05 TaxID=3376682 RepID=UPI003982711A
MYLYKINEQELKEVKEKGFNKEVELHKLCENNLENIFGLKFIQREFSVNEFRLDTLAFDEITKSFVIIEYKNTTNFSVVDQGYAYLATMLNNKADFILEYNEKMNDVLKRDEVDWSQSRVIFISPSFTQYQKQSLNFKDLPFELWEARKFDDDIIYFNPIKVSQGVASIKTIATSSEEVNTVNREVKITTEEDHLERGNEDIVEIYEIFKDYIMSLDSSIIIKSRGGFIGFDLHNKNLVGILINKTSAKVWINSKWGGLNDYKNIFRDVSKIGHWGNGDYEITINDKKELEYICFIIREAYNKRF